MNSKTTHPNYSRLRDWAAYNAANKRQYEVDVYLSAAALKAWAAPAPRRRRRGHPRVYSDTAYETVLAIGEAYRLPLRGAEAFTASLLRASGLELRVPDYTSLCRARARLGKPRLWRGPRPSGPLVILVDSTGVKAMGAGEWRAQRHDDTRKEWLKLHVAVDAGSGGLAAATVTRSHGRDSSDAKQLPGLVSAAARAASLDEVIADGAYDKLACYAAIETVGARATIPPQRRAQLGLHALRDENLLRIGARAEQAAWRDEVAYGRRALVETWMSKYKRRFGGGASARLGAARQYQLLLRAELLNLSLVPPGERYLTY